MLSAMKKPLQNELHIPRLEDKDERIHWVPGKNSFFASMNIINGG
jgi:hypothetical protein